MDWDHERVKRAGVKAKHLNRLLGISRVSASLWLHGHGKPHTVISRRAYLLAQAVYNALDDQALPVVSDQLSLEERSVKTMAIIRRYMRALEEPAD